MTEFQTKKKKKNPTITAASNFADWLTQSYWPWGDYYCYTNFTDEVGPEVPTPVSVLIQFPINVPRKTAQVL